MSEVCLHDSVHIDTIERLVNNLKESESCIVTLVCNEQKVVTINKIFVELFVKNISKILKTVETQDAIISVPLDANVIENIFDLVSKGSVNIDSDEAIERIKEGVELLGVDIEHDKLTHNKKPSTQVGNKVRRYNGVSKDTLLKIKEENKKRLKRILEEMNQDSNKKKEKLPQNKHENIRKQGLPDNSQDNFTEVIKEGQERIKNAVYQDKNGYFVKSYPECEDENKQISKCTWCNYETQKGEVSLTLHIAQAHKDKKLEKCSQCNYETYTTSRLNIHIKTTHVYSTCPFCKNDYKNVENHIKRGKGCSAQL